MATTSTALYSRSTQPIATASAVPSGPIAFLGRILFALIFLMSGPRHFLSQTIAFAAAQGVPLARIAVPLSGVLALAGALCLILGYRARLGAWMIVLFLAGVTPLMHNFWAVADPMARQMQFVMFVKNLSMLGAALFFTQTGSGPWSLDRNRK